MRTVALIAAALALLAAPAARAEIYTFSDWGPGFGSWHYDPGQPRGGPSIVAGWGDDLSDGPHRRYWGGPFFVDRRGYHPPYESYRLPGHRYCHNALVANADGSQRRVMSCR
jgi:hypothetical protein